MVVVDKHYFRLPNVFLMLLVIAGIGLLSLATFVPSMIPYKYLGPLGWLVKYLVDDWPVVLNFLMIFTIVSHSVEAWLAVGTSINKGIEKPTTYKWFMSVLLFGYFSYRDLLAYDSTKNK